ncbi:hypothetical protein BsWGS_14916 [Bradybaena similaris]
MAPIATLVHFILLTLTTVTLAVSQTSMDESPATTDSCYCLRQTVGQSKNAVAVIFYTEGIKERLLVVEQRGVVSRYDADGTKINTFMDIRDRVVISTEFGESRGLLSLVLDPDFHSRRNVYAYYIRRDEDKEYAYVSKFNAPGGTVDPSTEQFLLRIYQPFIHGNGGPMLYGDDGYLYIFVGDGGVEDDPEDRAQNISTFHGKVLRIDVQKQSFTSGIAKMYTVPTSNPMINMSNVKEEIFATGLRNVWGCSQDSENQAGGTGRIFCAETGTNKFDEINIIESGRNYGWSIKEGTECRSSTVCAPIKNEGLPIHVLLHTSSHALVGGYVYRGKAFTKMAGAGYYVYGDVMTGKTYFLEETTSGRWKNHQWEICDVSKCPLDARETKLQYLLAFGQDKKGSCGFVPVLRYAVHDLNGQDIIPKS